MKIESHDWTCTVCSQWAPYDASAGHRNRNGDWCKGAMQAKFTRDDLVRVAETMRNDAVRVARSMAAHDVDPNSADDIEDAEALVAELLGEKVGG